MGIMRRDVDGLSKLNVIYGFKGDELQEFMDVEDELDVCQTATQGNSIQAVVSTVILSEYIGVSPVYVNSDRECVEDTEDAPKLSRNGFRESAVAMKREIYFFMHENHPVTEMMRHFLTSILEMEIDNAVKLRKKYFCPSTID